MGSLADGLRLLATCSQALTPITAVMIDRGLDLLESPLTMPTAPPKRSKIIIARTPTTPSTLMISYSIRDLVIAYDKSQHRDPRSAASPAPGQTLKISDTTARTTATAEDRSAFRTVTTLTIYLAVCAFTTLAFLLNAARSA
jgi:hypothetical protein